jgi:heat-inducible transcriptional repressor
VVDDERDPRKIQGVALGKRERTVLLALVSEYIAAGEPVSSRTLSRKSRLRLSPATIRSVLADLEDAGYLAQPHTSSGRIPTDLAFVLFIDELMATRRLPPGASDTIAGWFQHLRPGSDIVRESGRLLGELTGSPTLVSRPRVENRTLLKVRFIPTRPGELLAVVVFSDGTVENRFLRLDQGVDDLDLQRLHALLEEVVAGQTLVAVRDHFARELEARRDELSTPNLLGARLVGAALDATLSTQTVEVLVEGQGRLLDSPELAGSGRAREIMRLLDDRERLVGLLERAINATHVQVFLGDEAQEIAGVPVSLVLAPYHRGDAPVGTVGVIGPTRMDYPAVVPLVEATASAMTAALAPNSNKGEPH